MAPTPHEKKPDKQRKYDDTFKAEALRLAGKSRLMRAAARQLGISEKLLYRWQQQQAAAELGIEEMAHDPEVRTLRAEVQAAGHRVGCWRIRRALVAHGLRVQQPRSFVPHTTDLGHGRHVAPNRLLGQPAPTAPNQVWVDDITCLPKQGGCWLYLASWQDTCSRKIVGWAVRETMPEDLVSEALRRALIRVHDERHHFALGHQSPTHFETHL